jgi:hypothetical protein
MPIVDKATYNAERRDRRKNDPEYRLRQNQLKHRSYEKSRGREVDVSVAEPAGVDAWLRLFLHLQSEDPEVVQHAKNSCRNKMELLLTLNKKADSPFKEESEDPDDDI